MRIQAGVTPGWEDYKVYDARTGLLVDHINWVDDVIHKVGVLVLKPSLFQTMESINTGSWPIQEKSCPLVIINVERKYILINAIVDELKSESECTMAINNGRIVYDEISDLVTVRR